MRRLDILIAVSLVALCSGIGCSDSSDTKTSPSHAGGSGGKGGGGAAAGSGTDAGTAGSDSTTPSLPDDTAGKACDGDDACGGGMCLTSIPDAFGGPAIDAQGGYCSGACMTDAQCGEGGVCSGAFAGIGGIGATQGRCMKGCTSADDCRDGYRCLNGLGMAAAAPTAAPMPDAGQAAALDPTALLGPNSCQPSPATTQLADGIAGKACENDSDCGAGRCDKGSGMMTNPGGSCTGSCLTDAECGADGSCALPAFGTAAGTCAHSCQSHGDDDCREGYRCRSNASRRQCLAGAAPLGDHVAGKACEADADCGGAAKSCVTRLGNADAPGGYCSQTCGDNTDCGVGGTCAGSLGAAFAQLLGSTGTCYAACTKAADCREGYTCGTPATTGAAGAIPGGGGMMMTAAAGTACVVAPPPATEEDAGMP